MNWFEFYERFLMAYVLMFIWICLFANEKSVAENGKSEYMCARVEANLSGKKSLFRRKCVMLNTNCIDCQGSAIFVEKNK